MKKLLLAEGILACFFLLLLFSIFGKSFSWSKNTIEADSYEYLEETRKSDTIWIYPGNIQDSFSALQYQTAGEENILAMCFSKLLLQDCSGNMSNHSVTASWEDDAQFAHISYQEDTKNNVCCVTIAVNPAAETASGASVTADDILFNYYLRADASSGLSSPFGGTEIVGQQEYYYGTKEVAARKKEIASLLKKPSAKLKKMLQSEIIEAELTEELDWVKSLYDEAEYQELCRQYQEAKDLFAYYFSYQTKYSSEGKSESQVFADIAAQFDGDYQKLSEITQKDYQEQAEKLALAYLLAQEGKDSVPTISGVCKIDEYTVEITIKGDCSDITGLCDIWILPLSQYGNLEQFDGKQNFGYSKGEAEQIFSRAQKKYVGSGAYYVKSNSSQKMVLCRNPHYFAGSAATGNVVVKKKQYQDYTEIVEDLLNQEIDLVVVQDSEELEELLKNNATRASSRIRKVTFESDETENCFVYRTSCVNTPSIPEEISQYYSLFEQFYQLQTNSTEK